tara:strand:+ start:1050 stop:1262 length:213 start_codon:yes stop_codon:yes gene_type:complete
MPNARIFKLTNVEHFPLLRHLFDVQDFSKQGWAVAAISATAADQQACTTESTTAASLGSAQSAEQELAGD